MIVTYVIDMKVRQQIRLVVSILTNCGVKAQMQQIINH